jgi:hypothetical protein
LHGAFFNPDGQYFGNHRKLMPTACERLIWGYGDGSTLPVIQTEVGRVVDEGHEWLRLGRKASTESLLRY